MEMMTVAPVAAALPVAEPPSARAPADEAGPGQKPFQQALKQELAKPDSDNAEAEKPEEAPAAAVKAATTAHDKLPVPTPEWAALLESAGFAEGADSLAHAAPAEDAGPAEDAELAADTEAAESLIASDVRNTPPHPLLATPAAARTTDTAVAQEKRAGAATSQTRARADALEARASRAADGLEAQDPGAQADASAPDARLAGLMTERVTTTEAPASKVHAPALEGLASTAFAPRWSAGQPAAADAAAVQTPATARIDTALGDSGWADAFKQKIVWLVDRQQQSAQLHVNPQHLGPVEVTLKLAEDGTHIAFSSPHAAVREAIEASLGDLKTALGDKGLSLGQATVGSDSQAAREQLQNAARTSSSGMRGAAADVPADMPLPQRIVQRGLVDIFA